MTVKKIGKGFNSTEEEIIPNSTNKETEQDCNEDNMK